MLVRRNKWPVRAFNTMSGPQSSTGSVVWSGRPSISVYLVFYGLLAAVIAAILVGAEVWVGDTIKGLSGALFYSLKLGSFGIPDVVEIVTVVVVLVVYLAKAVGLALYQLGHSYELRTDGIYVNRGIANLSNTFISAMAFSDARLVRSLGMRILGRSLIIIEANDGRKFELRMLKDGINVQNLIRSNLSHPTVRVEK